MLNLTTKKLSSISRLEPSFYASTDEDDTEINGEIERGLRKNQ